MPAFGQPIRPGGDPPPRQPLTAEQLRARESHTGKMAGAEVPPPPRTGEPFRPVAPNPETPVQEFNESEVRLKLNQLGLDFAIFPIGEKAPDPGGRSAYRERRLTELESERAAMMQRTKIAEASFASIKRERDELQVQFDTLQNELDLLKAAQPQSEPKENE